MKDIEQRHPFAKMSKDEILKRLRQTREEVYEEDYGHRQPTVATDTFFMKRISLGCTQFGGKL